MLHTPIAPPVGPFVTKPSRELGDITADIWQSVFDEKMADGSGPVLYCTNQSFPESMDALSHPQTLRFGSNQQHFHQQFVQTLLHCSYTSRAAL